MSDWTDIGPDGCLAEGEHLAAEVDGEPVAVFRVDGGYYAIRNRCSHDFYTPLTDGWLEGYAVICPRHGARFSLCSGKALCPPAFERVAVYAVRVEDGRIWVRHHKPMPSLEE